MKFFSSDKLRFLSPFEDCSLRKILQVPLSAHLVQRYSDFSDEFSLFENVWLSKRALQQLKRGKTIVVNNEAIAWQTDKPDKKNTFICKDSFEIIYPWHLLEINEQVIQENLYQNQIESEGAKNAVVEGVLHLGKGSEILPNVYIEGKVSIGQNCKIGPNCYLRGDTSIGDNCHIGQSVEIKNCYIMNNTNIGHLSYVGDSVIGDGVNLGAGTVVANLRHDKANHSVNIQGRYIDSGRRKLGVFLGDDVHTGINTSFYPACIMQKSTMTKPAEIIKS